MKIVVDTNVLISGTFWYGSSYEILKRVNEGHVQLILTNGIIGEYIRVLGYDEIKDKIQDKSLELLFTLERIRQISTLVYPDQRINIVQQDPSDNIVLEAAVAGNAQYIITNDRHLLILGQYLGIRILSPAEFLRIY